MTIEEIGKLNGLSELNEEDRNLLEEFLKGCEIITPEQQKLIEEGIKLLKKDINNK